MLVRMISRSLEIPWQVNVSLDKINLIQDSSWVIGVHEKYETAYQFLPNDVKIICIKRIFGHKDSLKRSSIQPVFDIEGIVNSFPNHLTVIYDEIIKESKKELNKIKKILNIHNIEYEQWNKRYNKFTNWRLEKYDENNPKLV